MSKYVVLIFVFLFSLASSAQQREVGLLDLSIRNAETNQSRIRSCRHILQVAGVDYDETTSLTQALTHPVVLFTPIIYSTTFNAAERLQIQQYVANGGVLIASSVRDPALYSLFGVSGFTTYTDLKRMTWHVEDAPQYFDRFDEGFEKVISLSDTTGPQAEPFNIRSYATTGSAQVLAHFDNNTNAVITNQTGSGRTFLFSLDLRDVIIRNLINSDLHAQRGFSNIFEPTTDTFIFFIMNVIREHMPNTVRAHTCPNCDGSVVMITHDVDSRTAMDTMQIFINYEEQNNLNAMYNITTRYFHDSWMTDFYNGSYDKVQYALQHGQRIASHSVGHFPDYDDETRFPFTTLGNTPTNYQPRYFNAITTGGNVYGEVEVSKYLLENDHNVAVKSFRAGHLAFNQRLPKALEDVGYLYNSTFSANDVLTNFPFWDIDNMTFSGNQTSVLEIPMTISDASAANPFTEQNALSIAQGWIDVTLKNHNNNAPTVLLIHPNRGYKLPAQQMFVNGMPNDVKFMFLDDFGDYWKKRMQMQVVSEVVNDTLYVTWTNYQMNQGLSLVIDDVDLLAAVRFFDGVGNELFPQSQLATFGETRFCQFVYDESFEVCNGLDDDGDGNIDENLAIAQYADADQDGYGDPAVLVNQCNILPGYVTNNLDCDDQSTVVHPSNAEYCDHLDNNCDGTIDEGFTWSDYYSDNDGDGFGNPDAFVSACLSPDNFVLQPGDCDDENVSINPNALEICNDIDDNCDINIDEGLQFETYYEDLDQDGYGNDAVSVVKCILPMGFVALHGDCSDEAPAINPGNIEQCGDGLDNDCNGQIDEGCIVDNDEDGFDATQDCDDENALIFPGAVESCNGFDDNCDGNVDESLNFEVFFIDNDADGFGTADVVEMGCTAPLGYVAIDGDCDDADPMIQPAAEEICDEIDNNCNGDIDEGTTDLYFVDFDGDGFGNPFNSVELCQQTDGFVLDNTDCDDDLVSIHPGLQEACGDDLDNNCDGQIDEGCIIDNDGDGFDSTVDCDDANAMINPGAVETCNNIDDNCNGDIDEGTTILYFVDLDSDGFGNPSITAELCQQVDGFVLDNTDCDDSTPNINPNGTEICGNAIDEDCSGTDEVCLIPGCMDSQACNYEALATVDDGSCQYAEVEFCNGLDDDCDGEIDENLSSTSIVATTVSTAVYPTCTAGNIFSANFNNAIQAGEILDNQGVVIWYKWTAQYNAIRVGLSAALGDNELRLYESNNGCLSLVETEHEETTGNQILLSDQLQLGREYYIAVRHLSGPINTSAKICVNHFVASTCDHVYSNYTGTYSSVCSSFKAQYRGNASQYTFNVLEPQPWSFTTTSSNSIVSRLGSILPVNVTGQSKTYNLSVDVNYLIPDVVGNYEALTALSTSTCQVVLLPEGNIALRASDRCPVSKTLSQSIATDKAICGTLRYEWKFTRTLPTSAPAIQVQGGMNTTVLFLNAVPGLMNNATYNVQIRAIHASGQVGEWGSVQCMKIGAASGMVLDPNELGNSWVETPVNWRVYPNPSLDGKFTLVSNSQDLMDHHIALYDAMGRRVWSGVRHFSGSTSIDFPQLSHGMYTIDIDDNRIRCIIGTE